MNTGCVLLLKPRSLYLEQHVLLVGREVHLVLVVLHTQVDDVGQELLVAVDHLQLLLQRLRTRWRFISSLSVESVLC